MTETKEKPAIEELFKNYSEDIRKYALSILGNLDDAGDVLQDVFLKFQLHEESFKRNCTYKTWLFTITRNTCYNKLREAARNNARLEDVSFKLYDGENLDDLISLKEALKQLDSSENEIIFLRDYGKFTYKEIAELVDISVANVKVKVFRAKNKLRNILIGDNHE